MSIATWSFRVIAVILLSGLGTTTQARETAMELLWPISKDSAQFTLASREEIPPHVLRTGQIMLDIQAIQSIRASSVIDNPRLAAAAAPFRWQMRLFPEILIEVQPTAVTRPASGVFVLSARTPAADFSSISLTLTKDGYLLTVTDPNTGLLYRGFGDAVTGEGRMTQIDPSLLPSAIHQPPLVPDQHLGLSPSIAGAGSAHTTTIDIMLVYDQTASEWVAVNGGMNTFSQDVVNRMNQAMANSGIEINFRLVHAMEVDYYTQSTAYSSLTRDLYALSDGEGVFSQVHQARNQYGADLVALMIDPGSFSQVIGLAWILGSWAGNPEDAFSVTAIRSVAINHTLTHEVGHNLGADHAKEQIQDPGPNLYLGADYAAGWYFTGQDGVNYHSIMAYSKSGRASYTEAPLFSTPNQHYQGTPAGDFYDGDNARLINQTRDIIAGYRATVVEPATDGYESLVHSMFIGYFGRPPSPRGLSYYTELMRRHHGNYRILVDDFYHAEESWHVYGDLSMSKQVNQVFHFLFGRDARDSGLGYWRDAVTSGTISLAEMAYTIAQNAQLEDTEVLDAKIRVAAAFTATVEGYQRETGCAMDKWLAREWLAEVRDPTDIEPVLADIESLIPLLCW